MKIEVEIIAVIMGAIITASVGLLSYFFKSLISKLNNLDVKIDNHISSEDNRLDRIESDVAVAKVLTTQQEQKKSEHTEQISALDVRISKQEVFIDEINRSLKKIESNFDKFEKKLDDAYIGKMLLQNIIEKIENLK